MVKVVLINLASFLCPLNQTQTLNFIFMTEITSPKTRTFFDEPTQELVSEDLKLLSITNAPKKLPRHFDTINNKRIDETDSGNEKGIIMTDGGQRYLCAFEKDELDF